ncbi:MAG: type VI secretion system contractile sheath large subunit [Byssovorax sp.]
MAGGETKKGWIGGSMKFGVGDQVTGAPEVKGTALPLRFLVVADLLPRSPFNAGASPPEGPIRIDPARFDDLFGKLRPRIAVEVPSVLAEGRNARVDLSPTSLKSFRPDGLLAEVPLLRSLIDGRLVLERLRDGKLDAEQAQMELDRLWSGSPFVREILGLLPSKGGAPRPAAPAPVKASSDTSIDSILDMVDVAGTAAAPAPAYEPPPAAPTVSSAMPSKFSELITSVARSARPGSGGIRPTEALNRIEKALGAQIGAILQHPEVRRIEQVWRGLRFLADRAQNHGGIRLDVLSARPDESVEALVRGLRDTAAGEPPVSAALVDLAIDGTPLGFARLETVAEAGETFAVPVIVNATPKLLGVDDLGGVEKLDNKAALFQAPQQAPWRAVAEKPALRWVTIAMNGVLLRAPYDKTTSRVREAAIKELPDDDGGYVWMSPAYAVGALILASFRETGWPCRIMGARSGGLLGDLPVRELRGGYEGDEGVAIPTEAFISTDTQRELSRCGVLALASAPNSDAVYVLNAPTAYVTPPKKTYDSATTEPELRLERVPLGDQLFVARLVQYLQILCGKLPATSVPAEAQSAIEKALWGLFENAAPGSVEINVRAAAHDDGTKVEVEVRPRRFLGVAMESFGVELPLG